MKMKLLMTIFLVTSIFFNSKAEEYPPTITISGVSNACTGEVYSYSVINDPTVFYQWTITNGTFVSSPTGSNSVDVAWYDLGTITVSTYSDPAFTMLINSNSLNVNVDVLSPYITMDPEVGCLDEKPHEQGSPNDPHKDENDCHKACEDNEIVYTANGNSGSSFTWEVIGDATTVPATLTGPSITVTWNSVGFGVVRLIETSANGCEEVTEICVEIIPKPMALFDVEPGLTVCVGQTVYFEDLSQAIGNADLTAWEWAVSDGTFQAYTESTDFTHVFNTGGTFQVRLRVYNTCGCYDDYKVKIKVISSPGPDIYCPKVVCPNEKTVLSTNFNCNGYFWAVTNGTILSGNGTPSITVMWDDDPSGVGYVELAVPCGACNIPTVLEIPIVSSSLEIEGPTEVCLGDQVTLTAPMIPGTYYDWSVTPSPGGAVVVEEIHNQVIIQVNGLTPITVQVDYNNELAGCGDGCGGTSTHPLIAVAPSQITGPQEVCVGDSEAYTISGPFTGLISVERPNGTSVNIGNGSNYTFTMDGLYVLTPLNAGCQGPPLLVNAHSIPPPPDNITGPDNICPEIPYEYEAGNDVDGTIYSWNVTGGMPTSGVGKNIVVTWNPSGPYELEVQRINIQTPNCASSTIDKTISPLNINPQYVLDPDIVCANQSYTYSLDYLDGEEYNWTINMEDQGSVITDPNSSSVDILWNNTTGTAVVTAWVRKCNVWYDVPLTVTISPVTNVEFTPSATEICQNQSVMFDGDPGFASYDWSVDPAFGGTIPSTEDVTIQFTQSGSFNVTLLATDVCGNVSFHSQVISVLPEPPSQLSITANTLVCSGGVVISGSATLVTSIIGGTAGHTFLWKRNGLAFGGTASTQLITDTGLYEVTVTNIATGCTAVETIKVKCPTGPPCTMPASNTGSFDFTYDNTTCGEVTFNQTGLSTAPGWTFTGSTYKHFGANAFNAPGPTYTYSSFDNAGYYNVAYELCFFNPGAGTCCTTLTQNVPIPVVADAEANAFCDMTGTYMIQLDDFSSSLGDLSGYDVTWIIGGTTVSSMTGVSSGTTTIPLGSLTPGTTYPVVMQVFVSMGSVPGMPSNYQCEFSTSLVIPALPVATFTHNAPVCEDLDVEFLVAPNGPNTTYSWDFDDGAFLIQNVGTASRKFDGPVSGGYNVSVTVTNSAGCIDVFDDNVNVESNEFDMPVVDVTPMGAICKPNPATLTFNHSGTATATMFDWSDGATVNPNVVFEAGGYIVTVADVFGCEAVSELTPVDIRPAPSAVIFGETSYCYPDDVPVELFGYAGPGFTYAWEKRVVGSLTWNTMSSAADNISDSSVNANTSYEYRLTVTDPNTGCSAVTIQTVDIHALPPYPSISHMTTGCNPFSIELSASPSGSPYSHNWSNGDSGTPITVLHGGLYEVTLTDGNGCTRSSLVDIEGAPNLDFFPVGCYVYCREDMPLFYPGPYGNFDNWRLYRNGVVVASGGPGPITNLAITDEGDYWLVVNDNGCNFTSGILNVKFDEEKCKEVCEKPCKIEVGKIYPEHIQDCLYEFSVDVYLGECTNILEYKWYVNGSQVPGGATMSYMFPSAGGAYQICVEVTGIDDFGNQCKDEVCIDFKPTCKCDCDIEASFDVIQQNCEFYFVSDVETSKCTKIKKYVWTIYHFGQVYDQITGPVNLSYGFNTQKPFEVCLTVYGHDGTMKCKDTYCENIFPCNEGSSIEDDINNESREDISELESPSISISPNPFSDNIRIQSKGSIGKEWHIVVIDVTGKLISNNTVSVDQPYLIISTDGWRSGMYQVYIADELGNSFAEKIIKVE